MYGSQTPTHGDGKVDLRERISMSKLRFGFNLFVLWSPQEAALLIMAQ